MQLVNGDRELLGHVLYNSPESKNLQSLGNPPSRLRTDNIAITDDNINDVISIEKILNVANEADINYKYLENH